MLEGTVRSHLSSRQQIGPASARGRSVYVCVCVCESLGMCLHARVCCVTVCYGGANEIREEKEEGFLC